MVIYLNNLHPHQRLSRPYFEKRIKKVLKCLELTPSKTALGISFVDDRFITRLNRRYLKKNRPTDVLSFPMGGDLLGDIVISLDTASRQAKALRVKREERVLFLAIHGLLHLLGEDHKNVKEYKRMRKKEEELWKMVGKGG